jgi:hypothetical protein
MTEAEILEDFPNLESEDIRACLAFAIQCLPGARPRDPTGHVAPAGRSE